MSPCDCYSLSPDVAALPPAAKLLQLSLIKVGMDVLYDVMRLQVPAISTDRGNLAATALHSLCWDHELTATIVSLPTMINNAYGAILYHPTSSVVPLGELKYSDAVADVYRYICERVFGAEWFCESASSVYFGTYSPPPSPHPFPSTAGS